ncbi:MAG TPA: translation elongation factor 4 [Armatimonadota bacterium]|jgi:GTP-binding protein LepA
MDQSQSHIRNFCIIAHIDHGKSTLADRILEQTGAISGRDMQAQILDSMDLERERGITIKMAAVRVPYRSKDGQEYTLNLIDTPGHVDFSYEVSRSLAACEGAILVVDAAQGVEAQTLANVNLAMGHNLTIIPVINKIDLPAADPERVVEEIEDLLAIPGEEAILCSAKEGTGVAEILEAIVHRVPPPKGEPMAPLRALIFDSHYDPYLGVVAYVRVIDGALKAGMKIKMMSTTKVFEVNGVGVFRPQMADVDGLSTGEVGFLHGALKDVADAPVGDTITTAERGAHTALHGYRKAKPMVYCGLYPIEGDQYPDLRDALGRLQLNDAALSWEAETSAALGFGFRCGFLGLLHMEIVQERLEREFNLELIATAPSVLFRITQTDGAVLMVDNPALMPPPQKIQLMEEPFVAATIIVPSDYVGTVMELCKGRRGAFKNMEYSGTTRVILTYDLPLSEILMDFFDQLKSRTRGYASFDYEFSGYIESHLVKLDILLNGEIVDALSFITHRDNAYARGKLMTEKLRKILPRQMIDIKIQASIGAKVIASAQISAMRKNVIAKCYGGDITRKRKLLEKQKEGKKRMKSIGSVSIPQEAFMSVLRLNDA